MKNNRISVLNIVVAFLCLSARSQATQCEKIASFEEVIECVLLNHPDLLTSEVNLKKAPALRELAAYTPNPEIEFKGARSWAYPGYNVEINLGHIFELGGKREHRIDTSMTEEMIAENQHLGLKESVYIESISALYRVRQLKDEVAYLEETLQYYTSVEEKYKARYRLSPEEVAVLSIIDMAKKTYDIEKIALSHESQNFNNRLRAASGSPNLKVDELDLPEAKVHWPDLSSSNPENVSKSFEFQNAAFEIKLAGNHLDLAGSNAWPNLKLGPTFEFQNQYGQDFKALGFVISLPLPIYHRNHAGEIAAQLEIEKSNVRLKKVEQRLVYDKIYFLQEYKDSVSQLAEIPSEEALDEKHLAMEQLFTRGVISGQMIIELHRHQFDLVKKKHQIEMKAIRSQLHIYAMEGRLFSEKL